MSHNPTYTEPKAKPQKVLIDPRKSYTNAFASPSIRLYLPTDNLGNIVCPTKAVRLECWTPDPNVVRQHLPSVFDGQNVGISNALIRHDGDEVFATLVQSVALGTLKGLNDWLKTMLRTTASDIYSFEVFVGKESCDV